MPTVRTARSLLYHPAGIIRSIDVYHMYKGCGITIDAPGWSVTGILFTCYKDLDVLIEPDGIEDHFWDGALDPAWNIKLHLKHIQDMDKQEREDYKNLCYKVVVPGKINRFCDTPQSLIYGITRGYDMFDLIENGFAIDINP